MIWGNREINRKIFNKVLPPYNVNDAVEKLLSLFYHMFQLYGARLVWLMEDNVDEMICLVRNLVISVTEHDT